MSLNSRPLVIDLDGTLIHADILHESAFHLFRHRPWDILRIPFWLAKGKASLKRNLALASEIDPASLPYNMEFLAWLKIQKADGRRLILCTATDILVAQKIAQHLGFFDEVIASDGTTNLAGAKKAEALVMRFGEKGFDYAGNSRPDISVWAFAHQAIPVNAPEVLVNEVGTHCNLERSFPARATTLAIWLRALRIHQWLKNLLLFVPLIAAHEFSAPEAWPSLLLAFLAFSMCASAVYIVNDLIDLESDRKHPRKCLRPFASGQIPAWQGAFLTPVLLVAAAALAWAVGGSFFGWLVIYFLLTCAYSWGLKRLVLLDCLTLALLYTVRILAGAAAVHMPLSFWLLAFAVFLFLSLAFVKRYAELRMYQTENGKTVHGRGYQVADAPLIQTMGITSGYAAALVLSLYLNSEAVVKLYRAPELVWGTVPVLLFWVSRMWIQAHRGEMHDDPLVFAIRDNASLISGIVLAGVLGIATSGWPW